MYYEGTTHPADWVIQEQWQKEVNVITDSQSTEAFLWAQNRSNSITRELEQVACCMSTDHLKMSE